MRRSVTAAMVVSALLVLALIPGTALAAKTPKINICHFDKRAGTLTLTTISESGLATHLAHGDALPGEGGLDANCQPVVVAKVFARAWGDRSVPPNAAYDAGTDLLYVELVDGNANDILDAGDVVTVNALPSDFIGGTMSLGAAGSRVVTTVAFLEPTVIAVLTADGQFGFSIGQVDEAYSESADRANGVTQLIDSLENTGTQDAIAPEPGSPSLPSAEQVFKSTDADDAWLEISITP